MEYLTVKQHGLLLAQAKLLEALDILKDSYPSIHDEIVAVAILTSTTLADEGVDLETNPYYRGDIPEKYFLDPNS